MAKDVQIEAGSLYANAEDRIVSGLLLPYGEIGQTNLGRFSIEAGTVNIPSDPDVVTLNVDHNREEPVGRATELSETAAGIVGTFKIAQTEEGDQLLAEIADGTRAKLSAEVKNVVIRARKAVSGSLFGAAVVAQGAFPSAALLAEFAEDTDPTEEEETVAEDTTLEAEVLEVLPTVDGTEEIIVDEKPEEVIVDVVDPETGETEEVKFVPETEATPDNQGDNPMGAASAPETLQAHKAAPASQGLATVVNHLSEAAKSGSRSLFAEIAQREDAKAVTSLFAALEDIAFDGSGSVGVNTAQPQWLGELWGGRTYERKYIPLIGSGALTALTMEAWKWNAKPSVAAWAGNKAAIPSNEPSTTPVTVTGQRYAGGHDWSREFRDFGRTDVIESALRAMTESYAKVTDIATIDALIAGATDVEAGTATTQVAWNRIMDGVEAIIDTAVPTFAVVASDLYRELVMTTSNDSLAYLNASLGLEAGTAAGFSIIPSSELEAGTVLVGAREAAVSYELGGSPIRVEAEAISVGGFDIGLFGYHAINVVNAGALALVAPAA
jgi:hypothetical protein